jgi:putative heme-binding domain-containing protein
VRLLTDTKPAADMTATLLKPTAADTPPLARRELASALRRLDLTDRFILAEWLFNFPEDAANRDLSLLYWYGVQPAVATDPDRAAKLAATVPNPLVRQFVARHLIDMPAGDEPAKLSRVVKLLGAVADDAARADVLRGAREALAGRRNVPAPAGWDAAYTALAAGSPGVRGLAEELALTFGDKRAVAALLARAADGTAPAAEREAAVRRLAEAKAAGVAPALHKLLADPAVRGVAVRALAAVATDDTPAAVLATYPALTPAERADAVQTLATRPTSAIALLDAVAAGTVPKGDITAFAARQIQALNDKPVSAKLAAVWGTVKAASGDRAGRIAAYKAKLQPESLAAADKSAGKQVFARQCGGCHKLFGEGGEVGPELTGSQRANLDYLLENVLDPNAVVAYDYKMTAFTLADGRTLTGIVRRETPAAVVVRTVNDEVTLPKDDIEKRTPTSLSVMPEGLFEQLPDAELRALVAYLMKK